MSDLINAKVIIEFEAKDLIERSVLDEDFGGDLLAHFKWLLEEMELGLFDLVGNEFKILEVKGE